MCDGTAATAAFLDDLIGDDPEAAEFFKVEGEQRPERHVIPPELRSYWRGWSILKDDRAIGAFGGAGGIYYTAISQYCRDHGIAGAEFEMFIELIRQMDAEYLTCLAEKMQKSASEKTS